MGLDDLPAGTPSCTCCGRPSVVFQRSSGRHLCATHFISDIETRVAKTVEQNRQILEGDRIAIALSGGKDSTALLCVLSRLLPGWPGVSLVAITVDEGIAGYRHDTIQTAKTLTKKFGVEHRIVSFTDLIGDDLDTILKGRETQACTVCGILRKKALMNAAQETGATKIALGHNLDDEAQSVLMNTLRGDLPRLVRDPGKDSGSCFIPRIKPLAGIFEKEIASYLFVQDLFTVLPECPYTRYALRAEVRSILSTLEYRYPGTMQHLIGSKKKIERYCAGAPVMDALHHCRECGDPCSGEICQFCRLRHSLGK